MEPNEIISGYLDVKISSKSRRGPGKRQWCELRRLDSIENGVEIKLRSNREDRQHFIELNLDRNSMHLAYLIWQALKQSILFMSGVSESDSQKWISLIRRMLSIATYIPVSIVDNNHSRKAGLVGLFGVLSVDSQDIIISHPCTGEPKISWKRYYFNQFHLQASAHEADSEKLVQANCFFIAMKAQSSLNISLKLLENSFRYIGIKRLSRSEGDICGGFNSYICNTSSPYVSEIIPEVKIQELGFLCLRMIRILWKSLINLDTVGLSLITKTPGGSETEDSTQDLGKLEDKSKNGVLPRRESGISLASGIYEEILDDCSVKTPRKNAINHSFHIYENPNFIIINDIERKYFKPPPLPPRRVDFSPEGDGRFNKSVFSYINIDATPYQPRIYPNCHKSSLCLSRLDKLSLLSNDEAMKKVPVLADLET
ncbi:hypothetical protein NQ317_013132 [Molorchus minor]|uniref:PH domain-containing protein n=1 Tax=Molorchus minor TaxID=1323400 RepID=A0ABQ9J2G0_9CUCU|nr:hypothetical protein NQ317_013132 [Molorchus minor]